MMNQLNPIRFKASFCLSLRHALTFLATLSFLAFDAASAENKLPEVQPDREWLGAEYADAVLGRFYQIQTDGKVSFSFDDIESLQDLEGEKRNFQAILKNMNSELRKKDAHDTKSKIVNGLKELFPWQLRELLNTLEQGEKIELGYSGDRLQKQLDNWIMAQPDHTIYPHEMMAKALSLTNGKAYLAWAVAWNVMRDNWQAAPARNYGERINKFASLTGERDIWQGGAQYIVLEDKDITTGQARMGSMDGKVEEKEVTSKRLMKMVVTKRGDEFSYLYHRIGVELFSMVIGKYYGSSLLARISGSAGAVGEWFKYTKTAGLAEESRKRVNNDLQAAASGQRLYKLIFKEEKPLQGQQIEASSYLKSNPHRYGKGYQLKGRPPAYFGSKLNPIYWAPTMSVDELKKRFFHALNYDADVFNSVILATTGDYERLHSGLASYTESGAKDKELNELLKSYQAGVRAFPVKQDVTQDLEIHPYKNMEFAHYLDPEYDLDRIDQKISTMIDRALVRAKQNGPATAQNAKTPDISSRVSNKRTCPAVFN